MQPARAALTNFSVKIMGFNTILETHGHLIADKNRACLRLCHLSPEMFALESLMVDVESITAESAGIFPTIWLANSSTKGHRIIWFRSRMRRLKPKPAPSCQQAPQLAGN